MMRISLCLVLFTTLLVLVSGYRGNSFYPYYLGIILSDRVHVCHGILWDDDTFLAPSECICPYDPRSLQIMFFNGPQPRTFECDTELFRKMTQDWCQDQVANPIIFFKSKDLRNLQIPSAERNIMREIDGPTNVNFFNALPSDARVTKNMETTIDFCDRYRSTHYCGWCTNQYPRPCLEKSDLGSVLESRESGQFVGILDSIVCDPQGCLMQMLSGQKITEALAFNVEGTIYYIGGGYGQSTNEVYILHLGSYTWTNGPRMMQKRGFFSGAVVGSKIYVFGGEHFENNKQVSLLNSCEYLDTRRSLNWQSCEAMSERKSKTAAVQYKGSVYLFGGLTDYGVTDSVEHFDVMSNRWTRMPAMKIAKLKPAAALLNDLIYVTAGLDANNEVQKAVDVFNPAYGNWDNRYMPATHLEHHVASMLAFNGKLYIAGAYTHKQVERFNPRLNQWELLNQQMQEFPIFAYANVLR
ncbi:hypothetical protein Ciccas_004850 [Cichlidogyrus casuarinus]|uniref:Uncharacterized protein n=1 Tax=Cichlidogyrus casuarinus TaxID=1844966 RepID=A0ABD2QCN2_9PLAT